MFYFKTNKDSYEFCRGIIECMITQFAIAREEAICRINKRWDGFEIITEDDMIYHETVEFWANDIYYGRDSRWWARGNDPSLTPLPFP